MQSLLAVLFYEKDLSCRKKSSDAWKLSHLKHIPMPVGIFLVLLLLSPPPLALHWSFHSGFLFLMSTEGRISWITLALKYLEVLVNMHLGAHLVSKGQLKEVPWCFHAEVLPLLSRLLFHWGTSIASNKKTLKKGKEQFNSNTINCTHCIDYSTISFQTSFQSKQEKNQKLLKTSWFDFKTTEGVK